MENILQLEQVCSGYGEKEILHRISFSLEEGRRLAILGPNGSGKTTLLRVIAGLLPAQGSVLLSGRPVAGMKREELARRVAMMSQFSGTALSYTVEETVLMGRFVHRRRGMLAAVTKRDREAARDCICAVGLSGLAQADVTALSGGQLQRVFLARTLAQEPSVILLDEPTSHLDLKYQTELTDYLKAWGKQKGHTVVGVLHDINLALRFADTFLFLKEGNQIAYGGPKVITPALLNRVYDMDVAAYMRESADRMEDLINGKDKNVPESL
ncbi:MAG: ABC transporter ATP-binding protein [Eubacteriales bacterium]|nr:ABC transporter ATP-binding protein [Eubacteriales bacterium]